MYLYIFICICLCIYQFREINKEIKSDNMKKIRKTKKSKI